MNDENFTTTTKELTREQYLLILWSFLTDVPEQEWNEFAQDLIYKNRFSSKHKVIDIIRELSEKCTAIIEKNQVLYRARIYRQDPLREFLSESFKNPDEKNSLDKNVSFNDYFYMKMAAIIMAAEKESMQENGVIKAYNKWKRKRFKGYKASDSGAPPADAGAAGRINPEKIRYLYLAEDMDTAIYEVRPIIGQYVSVASFKTMDEVKIYDLTRKIKSQIDEDSKIDYSLFSVIQQRFSEPNAGDAFRYLPTQYLGELIKQMGFDGLRFKSSLKNDGINVVLFDDKKCKAYRSDIIKVSNIELRLEKPEIYQIEEYLKADKGSD